MHKIIQKEPGFPTCKSVVKVFAVDFGFIKALSNSFFKSGKLTFGFHDSHIFDQMGKQMYALKIF